MHVRELIEKYYPEYYGWFSYPAEETVAFGKADQEWGILGNFGHVTVTVDGVPFRTTERLFQVMKFTDPEARRAVYLEPNPWRAKRIEARHYEGTCGVRPDWGEIIVDALKFCLMTKYEQCSEFREELARTGTRFIVEKPAPHKNTYSAGLTKNGKTWEGSNLMGRLLMELRDNGKLEYHLPEDAMRFSDLLEP